MSDLQAEQTIVIRYLLGDDTDEERDRVGEKSVVDREYGEFVEAVELELMELYVRDRLDPNQRRLFEQNFLVTRERREKVLAMSAILSAGLRRQEQRGKSERATDSDEHGRLPRRWLPSFFWNRPVFAICAVVLGVLLITAEVSLIRAWWRKREAPLIAMGEMSPKLHVQTARGSATVTELQVRSDLKYVALLLVVSDVSSKYVVELQADGRALWREEETPPASMDEQAVISVRIPTAVLKDGREYVIAWQSVAALSSEDPNQARYRVKYQH